MRREVEKVFALRIGGDSHPPNLGSSACFNVPTAGSEPPRVARVGRSRGGARSLLSGGSAGPSPRTSLQGVNELKQDLAEFLESVVYANSLLVRFLPNPHVGKPLLVIVNAPVG